MPLHADLPVQTMHIHGTTHIFQTGPTRAASTAPAAQTAQPDAVALVRPSIQIIVEHLNAWLAMELPYQPSMTPMEPPAASEVKAAEASAHSTDPKKAAQPTATGKLVSDAADSASALFDLVA